MRRWCCSTPRAPSGSRAGVRGPSLPPHLHRTTRPHRERLLVLRQTGSRNRSSPAHSPESQHLPKPKAASAPLRAAPDARAVRGEGGWSRWRDRATPAGTKPRHAARSGGSELRERICRPLLAVGQYASGLRARRSRGRLGHRRALIQRSVASTGLASALARLLSRRSVSRASAARAGPSARVG